MCDRQLLIESILSTANDKHGEYDDEVIQILHSFDITLHDVYKLLRISSGCEIRLKRKKKREKKKEIDYSDIQLLF